MWPFDLLKKSKRKYEGASKGRRTKGWFTSSSSANAEVQMALSTLRDRSRDLRRNHPIAASICDEWTSNVVGDGIKVLFQTQSSRSREKKIQAMWDEWAENCSFSEDMSLERAQRLVFDSFGESGEVLVRMRTDSRKPGFHVGLQIMECDHIDDSKSGEKIKNGIEYDDKGRRVKYHLFKEHPGEMDLIFGSSRTSVEVPSEEILHVFDKRRPGQQRGVPILAPVILRLRSMDEYEDAQLVRQKTGACFTAFVHDLNGLEIDEGQVNSEGDFGEKMEPGRIDILPDGKTVSFANPTIPDNYKEYLTTNLRSVSAGTGMTYEAMTGDYSNTNFSSGRMGHLKFQRRVKAFQKFILEDQFLKPLVAEFIEYLEFIGISTKNLKVRFVRPQTEMIDPTKEVPMVIAKMRGGLLLPSDAVASFGKDPDSHFEQFAKELKDLEKLGLKFDSDPNVKKQNGDVHGNIEEKSSDTE